MLDSRTSQHQICSKPKPNLFYKFKSSSSLIKYTMYIQGNVRQNDKYYGYIIIKQGNKLNPEIMEMKLPLHYVSPEIVHFQRKRRNMFHKQTWKIIHNISISFIFNNPKRTTPVSNNPEFITELIYSSKFMIFIRENKIRHESRRSTPYQTRNLKKKYLEDYKMDQAQTTQIT